MIGEPGPEPVRTEGRLHDAREAAPGPQMRVAGCGAPGDDVRLRRRQVQAPREGGEPSLVHEIFEQVRRGQREAEACGEPLAVARHEEQVLVVVDEQDGGWAQRRAESKERGDEAVGIDGGTGSDQRATHVARERVFGLPGRDDAGHRNVRSPQRADDTQVAHDARKRGVHAALPLQEQIRERGAAVAVRLWKRTHVLSSWPRT